MSDVSAVRQLRTARRALWWILGLSVTGIVFSGTLSYRELCLAGAAGCSVAQGGRLLGVPVCVYGLAMYLLVAVVAVLFPRVLAYPLSAVTAWLAATLVSRGLTLLRERNRRRLERPIVGRRADRPPGP